MANSGFNRFWLTPVIVVFTCVMTSHAHAKSLFVAVASNFAMPLQTLLPDFSQQTGIEVEISVGASGMLYAQLQRGAPYDVFFSADSEYTQRLIEEGVVTRNDVKRYAIGRLAYIGPGTDKAKPHQLKLLLTTTQAKLAIANDRLAPYGQAAKQTLMALGIWESYRSKLVVSNNVSGVLRFVTTGNAEHGFVSLAQAIHSDLTYLEVPEHLHSPIEQSLAITATQPQKAIAESFVAFILSKPVQVRLQSMGYQSVGDTP